MNMRSQLTCTSQHNRGGSNGGCAYIGITVWHMCVYGQLHAAMHWHLIYLIWGFSGTTSSEPPQYSFNVAIQKATSNLSRLPKRVAVLPRAASPRHPIRPATHLHVCMSDTGVILAGRVSKNTCRGHKLYHSEGSQG